MAMTLAKLKKELHDQENEPTNKNLYTKCCHSHLNFNYPFFSNSKLIKIDKEIKHFDLIEGTFNQSSNVMIKTLCELLDQQSHILKIQNSKLLYN
jgi:hypothetical protein